MSEQSLLYSEFVSWFCDGDHQFELCVERSIIDAVNLLFLSAFYSALLATSIRNSSREYRRRDSIFVVVSILCAAIGVSSFGLLFYETSPTRIHLRLSCIVRGLVWLSLSLSLLVRTTKCTRILTTVWWASFFLLITALDIRTLMLQRSSLGLLEVASWPLNLLLLFCAIRSCSLDSARLDETLSTLAEPLLSSKHKKTESGIGRAGFLSKLVFSWENPLLALGYKKSLSFDDVHSLVPEDEADTAHRNFSRAFGTLVREKTNHGNLVAKAVTKVFFRENIFIGICALLRTIAVVVSPLLLFGFVEFSSRDHTNLSEGFALVGCLAVTKVVESLSQRHCFFNARRSGMRMRSALMSAVYEKQLKLSSLGRKRHSTGEIVNYIAIDAYRMGEFPWWFHTAWTATFQVFLGVGLLLLVVGPGVVPGLVPLFIFGLLNVPLAKFIQKCQSQFMKAQDERLRSTSEILNSMKIIKLQSWEEKFQTLIESKRAAEFKWLTELQTKRAYGTAMYWMSPTIISSVVFLGCAFLGSTPLNAGTVFTVLAMLRAISEPVRMIPEALSYLIQVTVSFDRINGFLLDDELDRNIVKRFLVSNCNTSLEISTGSFAWDPESTSRTLENIDLRVGNGQKIAVCGLVGSGKSSLLQAILGEITKTSGNVTICGSIAYVSQTSWIQSGTVRDNILFGKQMEEGRYEMAIKACALDKDIDSFDHGDLTEIGQRGINMSGGQKQRIQLARAVYNDADIYLLDDPFSAVDAHTAAILFNDCVMTALKSKTVVLVTHQVEFLSEVDRIVVMESGRIAQSGSYEELRRGGTPFDHLVNAHKEAINNESDEQSTKFVHKELHEPISDETVDISEKGENGVGVQLTEEEERGFGNSRLKPFWDYFTISKRRSLFVSASGAQLGFVALQAAATYWLAYAIRVQNIDSGVLIGVYSGISGLSTFFVFMRSYIAARMGLRASKAFFSGFTDAIFKAPMLFFDSTPVGRILTRASSDMTVLDFDIPFSLIFVVASITELVATIIIMASVTWQVMIVSVFTLTATKYVQDYYLASARELTRINGTTKAPVMNFASETSLGVVTIRAFNVADRYFTNFMELVDDDAKLFFHSNAVMEWLVLRIEALQNLTLFTAAILLVLLPKGNMIPGLVGLSLSYALTMTGTVIFAVRWYCYLSNYVISVERIKQFMHVPPEPAAVVENHRPPSSWPSKGRIELDELKLRYRPNAPLVLKGITCTFKEGCRVGVVGRTGSGKTTLISALFRLVDPDSGKICIDGIDITSIGLKDLRMKLSIIPQEPTLFRGSVRTNMDPLGVYSDYEIWEALEKCQLKTTIRDMPNQLDSSVSDDGDNWSAGQRQLFCLGRVLLRRNKILVLDEATASIDSATDAILQRIIRQEFSECTVITVAHRVPTVIDSDMVMVLSFGKMVEYEEPTKLMERNSYFSKLVAEYWSSCRRSSSD